jgi:hypothetical protein
VPEGIIDVIPVDLVVAAIVAVAALGPKQAPEITQVASGGINPLKYRTLVDNGRGWFLENPIYDEGSAIAVRLVVPRRGRVQRSTGRDQHRAGEKVLSALPLGRQAALHATSKRSASSNAEGRRSARRVRALHGLDRLLGLWESLGATTTHRCVRPAIIDWDHYAQRYFPPSSSRRVKTTPGAGSARHVRTVAQTGARPVEATRGVRPREHAIART